jgi:hypothetical protein
MKLLRLLLVLFIFNVSFLSAAEQVRRERSHQDLIDTRPAFRSLYDIDNLKFFRFDRFVCTDKRFIKEYYRMADSILSCDESRLTACLVGYYEPRVPRCVKKRMDYLRYDADGRPKKYGAWAAAFSRIHWLCTDDEGNINSEVLSMVLRCENRRHTVFRNKELEAGLAILGQTKRGDAFPHLVGEKEEKVCLWCGEYGFSSTAEHKCFKDKNLGASERKEDAVATESESAAVE